MHDIKFNCPHCGQSLEAPEEMHGQSIICPTCNKTFNTAALAPPPFSEDRLNFQNPASKKRGCRRALIIISVVLNIVGFVVLLGALAIIPAATGIGMAAGMGQMLNSGMVSRVNTVRFDDSLVSSGVIIIDTNVLFEVSDIEKILSSAILGTDPSTLSVRVDVVDTGSDKVLYSETVYTKKNDVNSDIATICLRTNTFGATLRIRKH